eukprot:gene30544-35572_t
MRFNDVRGRAAFAGAVVRVSSCGLFFIREPTQTEQQQGFALMAVETISVTPAPKKLGISLTLGLITANYQEFNCSGWGTAIGNGRTQAARATRDHLLRRCVASFEEGGGGAMSAQPTAAVEAM